MSLIDDATIGLVEALDGLAAIASSHPHYSASCQDWARAFGAFPARNVLAHGDAVVARSARRYVELLEDR